MRTSCRTLFIAAVLSGAAMPAFAGQILVNGGFETGDLSGWTKLVEVGSSGDLFVVANADGNAPLSYAAIPQNATGGNYYALTDQTNPGSYVLTQSFTTDGASTVTVKFDLLIQNASDSVIVVPPSRDYIFNPNQNVVVDILQGAADAFTSDASDIVATLFGPGGDGINPWASYSFDLGILAAGTYQFRFGETDNQSFFQAGLDNVQVLVDSTSNDVPEPATLGLIGAGLLGLARARRRAGRPG